MRFWWHKRRFHYLYIFYIIINKTMMPFWCFSNFVFSVMISYKLLQKNDKSKTRKWRSALVYERINIPHCSRIRDTNWQVSSWKNNITKFKRRSRVYNAGTVSVYLVLSIIFKHWLSCKSPNKIVLFKTFLCILMIPISVILYCY